MPLPFPHLVGFGLQVDLLVREPFPFTLLGLVHLAQSFEQTRPLSVEESFDVSVRAVGMHAHRRGATVDLVTEVRTGTEKVWTGRSRYLARGVSWPGRAEEPARLPAPEGPGTLWRVPADTGRTYAAVSGDVNPLHLSPVTARLLGFRRALAHGMWTASRSLSAIGGPHRVLHGSRSSSGNPCCSPRPSGTSPSRNPTGGPPPFAVATARSSTSPPASPPREQGNRTS